MEDIIFLKERKHIQLPIPSAKNKQNKKWQFIHIPLLREDLTSISGHYLSIEWKNKPEWDMKFGIFKICSENRKLRIFQLEVSPSSRLTHRGSLGDDDIYGAHYLLLNNTKKCYSKLECDHKNRNLWFKKFLRHTNIQLLVNSEQQDLLEDLIL